MINPYDEERAYYVQKLKWPVDNPDYSLGDLQDILFGRVEQKVINPPLVAGPVPVTLADIDQAITTQHLVDQAEFKASAGFDTAVRAAVSKSVLFSHGGILTTAVNKSRVYNETGFPLTIISVRASVGIAPTGASVIVDVHKGLTTIFTNQANRPTIAVSATTALSGIPDITSWAAGTYLTVDIDQVGSSYPGAFLTVQIEAI